AIVLLENVASKATERVLAAELGKLSYAAQGLFINSSSFGANHEQEIVDSMASGMTWPKCFGKHQEAKRFLTDKLNRT
ncbi:unnamed protein product, partial [Durusdinium trenchii]